MAIALNIFLVPNRIVAGGASGIGTILYYLTGIDVGVWMLVVNIPLFLIGVKALGKQAMIRTAVATVLLSVFTDLTADVFFGSFDLVISSVYGGAVMGIGIGIVFLTSSATGGTDLAAKQLQMRFPAVSAGKLILIIDAVIIISSTLFFDNYTLALYGFISLYITGFFVDIITGGINFSKAVYIISENHETLVSEITCTLMRGVTVIEASGGYTGKSRPIVFCIITKGQLIRLKSIVKQTDPSAFLIITDAREVMGEGFYKT